jgi:hypothetical protein
MERRPNRHNSFMLSPLSSAQPTKFRRIVSKGNISKLLNVILSSLRSVGKLIFVKKNWQKGSGLGWILTSGLGIKRNDFAFPLP